MLEIYACLAGNWVRLNNDPDCKIGESGQSPYLWWNEGAPVYAPDKCPEDILNSFYGLNYVHIFYEGNDWRINPIFLQIVNG